MRQEDRMSPFQDRLSNLFSGSTDLYSSRLYEFCSQGTKPLPEVSEKPKNFTLDEMASCKLEVQFMRFLIALLRAKNVLEIGTFVGRTTLAIADALPEGGHVVTIEKGDEFHQIAQKNFKASRNSEKIVSLLGDAFEVLPSLKTKYSFDLVYLDGAKQIYPELFEAAQPLLKPNGVIVVDDVLFNGDALNTRPSTDKGEGTKRCVEMVTSSGKWVTCTLPVFNGIMLATPRV